MKHINVGQEVFILWQDISNQLWVRPAVVHSVEKNNGKPFADYCSVCFKDVVAGGLSDPYDIPAESVYSTYAGARRGAIKSLMKYYFLEGLTYS